MQTLQSRVDSLKEQFDIHETVLCELLRKDIAILCLSEQQVIEKYEKLASSFGSFKDDAVNIILADPSILLKDTVF